MASKNQEQQQYIELLSGIYHEILPVEQELGLLVSDRDQRPRIDYFYDALRALINPDMPLTRKLERLSLEWLAYDATAIRYLENKPLSPLNPKQTHQSPSTQVAKNKTGSISTKRSANREDKAFLSKCYLRFGVMFVALFKPFADRDHKDRVEDMDEQVQELSDVKNAIEQLGQGQIGIDELMQAASHTHDEDLKKLVRNLVEKQHYKQSSFLKQAMSDVKAMITAKDKQIAGVQAAHLNFAASQLALYEAGKDVVKQLASQGLNVAGQHLDNALSQTNDRGRGR